MLGDAAFEPFEVSMRVLRQFRDLGVRTKKLRRETSNFESGSERRADGDGIEGEGRESPAEAKELEQLTQR